MVNENNYTTDHPNTESWLEALISPQLETYRHSVTSAHNSPFEPPVTSPEPTPFPGLSSLWKSIKHCPFHAIPTLTQVCVCLLERGGQKATFESPSTPCRSCGLNSSPQAWQQLPLPAELPCRLLVCFVCLFGFILNGRSQQEIL